MFCSKSENYFCNKNHEGCYEPWDVVWEYVVLPKNVELVGTKLKNDVEQRDPNLIWIL